MRTARNGMWLGILVAAEGPRPSGGSAMAKGGADRIGLCGGRTAGTTQSFRCVAEASQRRVALWAVLISMLSVIGAAGADPGVTARLVPEQVRPGDVFELRVEMTRADYGRFELRVPPHGSLHRVAVESEPVRLEDGRYRQRESWMLQADRSGEIVIDGAVVVLKTGSGEVPVVLPPLRVEVMPWGAPDKSAAPVAFPKRVKGEESKVMTWWWLVPFVASVCLFAWWLRRPLSGAADRDPGGGASLEEALADLDAGSLRSLALEQLMFERGDGWPRELREAAAQAVYAGRGDAAEVADLLRKEAGK